MLTMEMMSPSSNPSLTSQKFRKHRLKLLRQKSSSRAWRSQHWKMICSICRMWDLELSLLLLSHGLDKSESQLATTNLESIKDKPLLSKLIQSGFMDTDQETQEITLVCCLMEPQHIMQLHLVWYIILQIIPKDTLTCTLMTLQPQLFILKEDQSQLVSQDLSL